MVINHYIANWDDPPSSSCPFTTQEILQKKTATRNQIISDFNQEKNPADQINGESPIYMSTKYVYLYMYLYTKWFYTAPSSHIIHIINHQSPASRQSMTFSISKTPGSFHGFQSFNIDMDHLPNLVDPRPSSSWINFEHSDFCFPPPKKNETKRRSPDE